MGGDEVSEQPKTKSRGRAMLIVVSVVGIAVIGLIALLPAWVVRKSAEAYSVEQIRSVRDALRLYVEHGGTVPAGPAWHVPLLQQGYVSTSTLQPPRANRSCEVCVGHVDGLTDANLRERGVDPASQLWLYELPACVDGDDLAIVTFDGRARLEPRADVVAWIERVQAAGN